MLKPRNTRNMRKKAGLLGTTCAPACHNRRPRRLEVGSRKSEVGSRKTEVWSRRRFPPSSIFALPSPIFAPILALVLRYIVTVS